MTGKTKKSEWDVDMGRELYDQGLSYPAIADRCGTSTGAVANRARDWPVRVVVRPVVLCWDCVLARNLWEQGKSYGDIAKECRTTKDAIMGYAKRHWPVRPGDAERYAKRFLRIDPDTPKATIAVLKAKPLPPGARTLPDLPSLRGYY